MKIMKQKALALAAIFFMALLILVQLETEQDLTKGESLLLLPELREAIDSASEIKIFNGNNESQVTILNRGNGWRVQEKSGYPANFETLSDLLRDMAELKVLERKTAKAKYHAELGLTDDGESKGVIVRISADKLYEMMVGHTSQSRGTFVRKPDKDQVYLVEQTLEVSSDPIDYLNPVFLSLESSEVETVVIRTPDSLLKAVRDETTKKMIIEDIPEGAELRYETVADSLARIFINLRFNDVEPYRVGLFNQPSETIVTTSSGDSKVIRSENINDSFWVQMGEDWQYEISEYTFNELNKSMNDMLKMEASSGD